MIKSTRFLFMLKLTFFLAFILTTFSQLLLIYTINLSYFLENTFLSTLNNVINNSFTSWIFIGLRSLSIFLMVGCTIGFIILFYYDVVKKQRIV